jgi:hypothetical protein
MFQNDIKNKFYLVILDFLEHYCELGSNHAIILYSGLSPEKDGKSIDKAMDSDLSAEIEKHIHHNKLTLEDSIKTITSYLEKYYTQFNFHDLLPIINELKSPKESKATLLWKEIFKKYFYEIK